MTRGRVFALVATCCLLVALGVVAFRHFFEKVEVTTDRGPSGQAAVNDFYALQLLMERLGLASRTVYGARELPPTDHVLWWLAPTDRLPMDRLLRWAEQGGHLVVAVDSESFTAAEEVGIYVFGVEQAEDDDHEAAPVFASDRPDWPKLCVEDGVEALQAEGPDDAAWNLTVAHGEGRVTVHTWTGHLLNWTLAEKDHARIARHLASGGEPLENRAGVWLVDRNPTPSVWVLLASQAGAVSASLVALVLFGLWAFTRRMGPPQPPPSRDRRHLAEHVRASGGYLWAIEAESSLLGALRASLARHLGRGPRLSRLSDGRGEIQLAKAALEAAEKKPRAQGPAPSQTGRATTPSAPVAPSAPIDVGLLRRALGARDVRDPDQFTRFVRVLETLRRTR